MTKPLPFTKAAIKRAVAGAREAGLRVTAISLIDGKVIVDDGQGGVAPPPVVTQTEGAPDDAWAPQA